MAGRLSEDPGTDVTVLEAGPWDRGKWDSWKIQMPAALVRGRPRAPTGAASEAHGHTRQTYNLANDKYNWMYHTEPQEHLDKRRLVWPRGRVVGGSSSLNAMVYM